MIVPQPPNRTPFPNTNIHSDWFLIGPNPENDIRCLAAYVKDNHMYVCTGIDTITSTASIWIKEHIVQTARYVNQIMEVNFYQCSLIEQKGESVPSASTIIYNSKLNVIQKLTDYRSFIDYNDTNVSRSPDIEQIRREIKLSQIL